MSAKIHSHFGAGLASASNRPMRNKGAHRRLMGAAALLVFALGACQPMVRSHGYTPRAEQLQALTIGLDDQSSVAEKIGRPSNLATFGGNEWYYVSRKTRERPLRPPLVTEQRVVVLSFNEAGIVSDINSYGLEDGKVVDLVTRTTPTRGRRLTVLQQLFGNIGRFNVPDSNPATGVGVPGSGGASPF